MFIQFTSDDEKYLSDSVKNGDFGSQADAVINAVRIVREQKEARTKLLEAIELGEKDIESGLTIPYTPTLLQELYVEAMNDLTFAGMTISAKNKLCNLV